ncbi:unnamed protein product, partial [Discosporangium mesarthrocarpum]
GECGGGDDCKGRQESSRRGELISFVFLFSYPFFFSFYLFLFCCPCTAVLVTRHRAVLVAIHIKCCTCYFVVLPCCSELLLVWELLLTLTLGLGLALKFPIWCSSLFLLCFASLLCYAMRGGHHHPRGTGKDKKRG